MHNNITLRNRLFYGFIIGVCLLIAIISSYFIFIIIESAVIYCMIFEWYNVTGKSRFDFIAGLVFILFAAVSLLIVKLDNDLSYLLAWYFITVSTYDSFAFFGGTSFGGPKLAYSISPNKTWSGAISGLTFSIIMSLILNQIFPYKWFLGREEYSELILSTIVLAFLAQISDLFASFFKRKYKVKDYGNIIPGHGGVLDRFDSSIFSAPYLLFLIFFN
ncbi:MAG: phosphatidate cytidylyltransferase [Rickettsiaceae bacterium]|nr:phosphatidate cytidylyltransferase [Rickettsiaceae bacterium]